jgi:Rrf2 family protein
MRVSARAEYGCLAMMALAQRARDGAPARIREIAAAYKIPERYLVQILLQLKRSGLVHSVRGAAGGYRLARAPERVTLAEILSAVDGPSDPAREDRKPSSAVLAEVWREAHEAEREVFRSTTLETLVTRATVAEWVI